MCAGALFFCCAAALSSPQNFPDVDGHIQDVEGGGSRKKIWDLPFMEVFDVLG